MKKLRRPLKVIFGVVLIASSINVAAQEENGSIIPQITPPSPQSQVFEKYINHQISEYNGLPDITIPLYVIKLKGLEIPISLSYHASGIKWKQYDGEVGAGWSIGASGYRISRTVHGRPDEDCELYNRTYLEEQMRNANNGTLTEKTIAYRYFGSLTGAGGTRMDGGQDVYSYLTPTGSGNFIISDYHNFPAIKKLDKSQSVIRMLDERRFTIRDDKGILYSFGTDSNGISNTEQSVEGGEVRNWTPTTAWGLWAIETPFNETVNFKYQRDYVYPNRNATGTYTITDAMRAMAPGTMISSTESRNTNSWSTPMWNTPMMTIQEIKTDYEIITFQRIADRTGKIQGSYTNHCIDYILINSIDGSYSKKITFRYKTIPETESNPLHTHNVLTGIEIADSQGITVETYSFEYNEPPGGYTYRQAYPDRWGYYAVNSGSNYEQYGRYLDARLGDDTVLFYCDQHYNIYKYKKANEFSNFPWRDRTPDNTDGTHYFSLKKITFPTKGTAEYIYEPNKYYDNDEIISGAGQRISKIISSDHSGDTPPVVTIFKYGENEDGIGIPNISNASGTIDNSCFVRESLMLEMTGGTAPPLVEYSKKQDYPVLLAYNSYEADTPDAVPDDFEMAEDYDYSVQEYSANPTFNTLAYAKERTYLTNPVYPEYNDFHVQYNVVTTYQYDETTGNSLGKTRSFYAIRPKYHVQPVGGSGIVPCVFRGTLMVDNYNIGDEPNLKKRETYNGDGKLIDEQILEYDDSEASSSSRQKRFEGVWVGQQLIGSLSDFQILERVGNLFGVSYYFVNATWRNLIREKKISYDDEGNNPVVVETEYEYDSLNRLERTIRILSDGSRRTQKLTYPVGSFYPGLISYNMISTVIVSETKHDETTVEKIIYGYPSNSIRMDKILTSKGGDMHADITFDLYDSKGNILQYTTADGVSTTYLWSYNFKYPVIEIRNATYEEVNKILSAGYYGYALAYATSPSDAMILDCRDTIASKLPNALVSAFTYKPLIGVTSVTDPSGKATYYEYDAIGRLVRVKDGDMNILEEYEYHYKN